MKRYRGILLLGFDLVMVLSCYLVAIVLRYDFRIKTALSHEGFISKLPLVIIVFLLSFLVTKTYKSIWEKVSIEEGFRILLANTMATTILVSLHISEPRRALPVSVIFIAFLLNTLFQEMTRFSYRLYRSNIIKEQKKRNKSIKRILIYGAGKTGALISNEINSNSEYDSLVVGFIDDNPDLKGKYVTGSIVFGSNKIINNVIKQQLIDEIIIAMPNQSRENQDRVLKEVFKLGLPVKLAPKAEILLADRVLGKSLKKIEIVDLLSRNEIVINDESVPKSIENKNILVTGAAGSIGSELVRQISKSKPNSIVLLDIYENGLYEIQQELKANNIEGINIKFLVASIRDRVRLDKIFSEGNFDMVFHAAAHKHVPLMEESPSEAIKNNIFGTYNLIECAKKYEVDKFINISTDKAVNPTNVMGATKRFNEMLLQNQPHCRTKFMAVRFGNVLGSNGSVVPHFTRQIEAGGPITVTHKDITRYFMTIPEAVSLVLLAETYANGGEIFVLDMGEPVRILDLAEQMIILSGNIPYENIKIEFTGLRPGEKLYEELLMSEEGLIKTNNDLIFIAQPIYNSIEKLQEHLHTLDKVIGGKNTKEAILNALANAVPTFKRTEDIL